MHHVATEDFAPNPDPGSIWLALRDLALSLVVVAAIALMVGLLAGGHA